MFLIQRTARYHEAWLSLPSARPEGPPRLRRALLSLAIAAGILYWGWHFVTLPRDLSVCTTDFSAFYAGGKLAGMPQTYSPDAVFAVEDRAMGCHMQNLIFIKPPFYAVLMWPLAQLPFMTAIVIWRILGLAALGAFLWLWPGDRLVHAAGCVWFLPVATSFNVGQDVAFVLAAATGAYLLLRTGRPFLAGVLFGLCAIKFHLFLLLPLLIFHRRLWRTALGGLSVLAVFLAISFAAYGPRLAQACIGAALQDPRMQPAPVEHGEPQRPVPLPGGVGDPWRGVGRAAVLAPDRGGQAGTGRRRYSGGWHADRAA